MWKESCKRKEHDITELLLFVLFDWLLNLLLSFKTSRKQLSKEFERRARLKSGNISKRCICEGKLLAWGFSTFFEVNVAVTRRNPKICIWWEKEVVNSFRTHSGKLSSTAFWWLRWEWVWSYCSEPHVILYLLETETLLIGLSQHSTKWHSCRIFKSSLRFEVKCFANFGGVLSLQVFASSRDRKTHSYNLQL